MVRYLNVEEILRVATLILGESMAVRDRGLLEAAAARPAASAFGEDAYPTIQEKAAALLHSLILNHPFVDGNKRIGTVTMLYFLEQNGWGVKWEQEEALSFLLEVAQGKYDVPAIAEWLCDNTDEIE